jgi:hypothetical protein
MFFQMSALTVGITKTGAITIAAGKIEIQEKRIECAENQRDAENESHQK